MNYGSICSGVEAASLAWRHLGWTPVFFSEVEPFPAAVLMQRLDEINRKIPSREGVIEMEVKDE